MQPLALRNLSMNSLSDSVNPQTWREFYDLQAKADSDSAAAGFRNEKQYAAREEHVKRVLKFFFGDSPPRVLLDIGCNRGFFAEYLSTLSEQTIGLDYAEPAVRYCREHDRYSLQLFADGIRLPLPETSVDACVLLDSLTSCDMPDILIAEASRVLKPGGRIFIETLCYQGAWLETLRFIRATFRDLLRRSKKASLVETVRRSFNRSFRPALNNLPLNRPRKDELLSALENVGIKEVSIHETRLFKFFPRERIIVCGIKV